MVLDDEHGDGRRKKGPWKGHDQMMLNAWITSPFFVNWQPSESSCHAVPFHL